MQRPGLLALAFLLAGCSGPNAPPAADTLFEDQPAPAEQLGLEASATTGVLLGVAVDDALRPLADVTVTIQAPGGGEQATATGDDGLWGFDGLAPGTYVVRAELPLHVPTQAVASVRAGVRDPPLVNLVLDPDREALPYVVEIALEGFLPCGVRGGTGGVHCAQLSQTRGALGDRSTFVVPVDPGMSWMQAELVWEATQPLADQMGLYFAQVPNDEGNNAYMGIYPLNQGVSPVTIAVDGNGTGHCTTCVEAPFNNTRWAALEVSVRSGELSSTTPPETCSPTGSPCLAGTGATVNQRFQVFLHVLYRATPPPGWLFSRDGPPLPPS